MSNLNKIRTCLSFVVIILLSGLSVNAQMEFVENRGQWHPSVKFKGDFLTGSLVLEEQGFAVMIHDAADMKAISELTHNEGDASKLHPDGKVVLHSFAYRVNLLHSNRGAEKISEKPAPGVNNYFIGNNPANWAEGCRIFQAVTYKNIYPNIDVRYYSENDRLKYDFIVHPGGKVSDIAMNFIGPDKLSVKDKQLIISTPVGEIKELSPYSYQAGTGKRVEISSSYVVKNGVVTFDVGDYDLKSTLTIDPSVIFTSFTGSRADNWGYTATPGPDGSLIAGGIVFAGGAASTFPWTPGTVQSTFGGGTPEDNFPGYDMGIFKFSPNGSARIWATFIGGNGNEQPHSMITDAGGNLVIAGRTTSTNYPSTFSVPGSTPGGYDIVVTRLSAAGALLGSVKVGGSSDDGVNIKPKYPQINPSAQSLRRNYGDDARSEVILDGSNNIYLASCTQSSNFPTTAGAFQRSFGGGQDGLILKFNSSLSGLIFSSFFGGASDDACFVTSINPLNGDLYVGGATSSAGLPGLAPNVLFPTLQGNVDGFVTQVKTDGSAVVRTSYMSAPGLASIDLVYGLKFDKEGFPYIMGTTTGNWPVTSNVGFINAGTHQFIAKLRPDLSNFVYSTTFGNGSVPNISPIAFLVDRCENVYVSGWGGGINVDQHYTTGTTFNMPEVNPLSGIPPPDGRDFYFFVLEKNAASQLFGSHYGQFGGLGDHVDGGTSRFDENGVIYQAVCANCGGGAQFPTTPGVWGPVNGSSACNEAVIKIEMNFSGVGAGVQASILGDVGDSTGCIPLTVNFKDTVMQGKKYYWDFGDAPRFDTTTSATNTHTYRNVGTYRVMLIAEDSTTCNIRDTAYITIRAGNNISTPNFNFVKVGPCESLTIQFNNTSTANPPTFNPHTFIWDYGDNTPADTADYNPPRVHTYAGPGTYKVRLTLLDTSFCNSPAFIEKTVRLNPLVDARFKTDSVGCAPYTASFTNQSLGGTRFTWDFGDGQTGTDENPTHDYPNPGTYTVRLTAIDSSTCNIVDDTTITIRVVAKPVASFSWQPNPPQINKPVQYTNISTGASRYLWEFGDGETSTEVNPEHQFNETGQYRTRLTAYNKQNCTDTFSLLVDVIVNPLLDVPNAFTPGRFGQNAIISVKGFGIGKMDWRIYNRWGQMVFQTNSRKTGWDGMFKGKLQPMDVYAYTLDVEFTDGKKLRKTGDITLLR